MIDVKMELREHPNREFMPKYDRYEPLILDATAINTAKMCKRKFFFQIVLGRKPKHDPVYLHFGSAYHKFREVLDFKGDSTNASTYGDFKTALLAALAYWDKHQGSDPDITDKQWSFMTRQRLMQSCTVGFNQWEKEKQQGKIEVLAVEQPFNVEVGDGTGEFTSGRFDQIIRWAGKIWGRDFKTSKKEGMYYQRGLTPNDQFTRYTYAESKLSGEKVSGQYIELLYNSGNKQNPGPIITPYPTARTDFDLQDWERDELQFRKELSLARLNDTWPKNEGHCTFCQFHSVCKMGNIASQQSKLEYEFIVKPWDNTRIGED